MRRAWALLLPLALGFPAWADSPEPDRSDIAAAAETCTADGAFGYHFRDKAAVPHDIAMAPFAIEKLGRQREGLFEITAVAWFGKAPMSGEDRNALAIWVYHALDTQIVAQHRFAKRALHKDGVTYFSTPDPKRGFALDLSHEATRVRLVCTDLALKKKAWKEGAGPGGEPAP